jgi:glycosyltransferase involved in cell wall biosynthesis
LPYKILYLENGAGFGGAVTSLRSFLENRNKDNYAALLVHSFYNKKFSTFDQFAERYFLPNKIPALYKQGIGGSVRDVLLSILPYSFSLARIAYKKKIDLFHLNNDITCNIAGIIAAKLSGRPVIVHERDIPVLNSRLSSYFSKCVDHFFAVSEICKKGLLSFGIPEHKITTVPEGLDFKKYSRKSNEEINAIRKSLDADRGPLILMAGMITAWKGQHILIEALPKLIQPYPEIKIVFIGEPPRQSESYFRLLKERMKSLNLSNHIIFAGYRSDIHHLMQAADVVVHASTKGEPFGRVIIEGMLMKTPVVATNIGAPPEIITHGKTGFLVPPGKPKLLSEMIHNILNQPDLANKVATEASMMVQAKYSIEYHTSNIERIYERLILN